MAERRTTGDVYEAVIGLRAELKQQLAEHNTRISVLENGRKQAQAERANIQTTVDGLENCVHGIQIKQAGFVAIVGALAAVIGALVANSPQIIQAWRGL